MLSGISVCDKKVAYIIVKSVFFKLLYTWKTVLHAAHNKYVCADAFCPDFLLIIYRSKFFFKVLCDRLGNTLSGISVVKREIGF